MTQAEIESMLIAVVCEIQQVSGRKSVVVTASTCPVMDVPGFDSLNGVEATVEALERLKTEIDVNNVFIDNDRPLTIRDAASQLLGALSGSHQ